jgi:hypothetical protein
MDAIGGRSGRRLGSSVISACRPLGGRGDSLSGVFPLDGRTAPPRAALLGGRALEPRGTLLGGRAPLPSAGRAPDRRELGGLGSDATGIRSLDLCAPDLRLGGLAWAATGSFSLDLCAPERRGAPIPSSGAAGIPCLASARGLGNAT